MLNYFILAVTLALAVGEYRLRTNRNYLIYNKKYYHTRLTQFNSREVGTYQGEVYDDQRWYFTKSHIPNCFYINNVYRKGYRLADSKHKLVPYKGQKYDDQLWKFVQLRESYFFRIENCYNKGEVITKFGPGDKRVGMSKGAVNDNQYWQIV